MPTFFAFQQGNESRHPPPDSRYGPGRFRLLPDSVINFPAALTNSLPGSGSAWGGGKGRNGRRKSIFDIFRRRGSDGAGRYERLVGYGAAGRGGAGVGMGAAGNRYSYGAIDGAGAGARRSAGLGLLSGGDVENEDDGEGMEEDERWWWERYIWAPRKRMAARIVGDFWGRFGVLVLLPAGMVSCPKLEARHLISANWFFGQVILWTAIPFPTYPLDEKAPEGNSTALYNHHNSDYTDLTPLSVNQLSFSVLWQIFTRPLTRAIPNFTNNDLRYFATSDNVNNNNEGNNIPRIGGPGHGEALVRLNFWFFLFVYYGFYNFIGLLWITKLFNLYSLNW